jgi:hypothetical protein
MFVINSFFVYLQLFYGKIRNSKNIQENGKEERNQSAGNLGMYRA